VHPTFQQHEVSVGKAVTVWLASYPTTGSFDDRVFKHFITTVAANQAAVPSSDQRHMASILWAVSSYLVSQQTQSPCRPLCACDHSVDTLGLVPCAASPTTQVQSRSSVANEEEFFSTMAKYFLPVVPSMSSRVCASVCPCVCF
jgi:hypothetical protein